MRCIIIMISSEKKFNIYLFLTKMSTCTWTIASFLAFLLVIGSYQWQGIYTRFYV